MNEITAILLISCPDRRGIAAKVTDFIFRHNGSIEHADQHADKQQGIFFMRIEWSLEGFDLKRKDIETEFNKIAEEFKMQWELHFTDEIPQVAIFVSKELHCLYDFLYRYKQKQLKINVPLIISNHPDGQEVADQFDIPYTVLPVNKENKKEIEQEELKLLKENEVTDIVLARYMQILSGDFIKNFQNRIINIHHSFLPAFAGAKPYHQAHDRGVKIIGATSHYVTEELDAGPIIEQDVARISHRDDVSDLVRTGEDLEKMVLSRAVRWHFERKILVYNSSAGSKTVIFD